MEARQARFSDMNSSDSFRSSVLACGGYITNHGTGTQREIDTLFDVTFRQEATAHRTGNRRYAFRIHLNDAGMKPVIHPRQLSGDVPDMLLQKMAETIRRFLAALSDSTQLP